MLKKTFRSAAILALLAGLCAGSATAAELKVLCANALRPALQELAPAFEKSSGHKLSIQYDTAGKIEEKVAAEDPIDVAILTKPQVDKLVRVAKLVGGSTATLASTPIGVAVKKGAPKPDIGSVDTFKKTLLNAKAIATGDPTSGAATKHVVQVIEKLGIAAELKPKMRFVAVQGGQTAPVGDLVAKGEAELAILPIGLLKEVQGIEVVGPLPAELQSPDLVFVGAAPPYSEQALAAKAFIDFLAAPTNKAVYKAKGMEPAA